MQIRIVRDTCGLEVQQDYDQLAIGPSFDFGRAESLSVEQTEITASS